MLEQWDEDELANGQECELSILFIDIRGFTTLSETMPSREVVELLNAYHSRMVEAIFRNGGTLDKYLGDGLVAYFNAPVDQEDHALRALNCALDMENGLEELNQERAKEGKPPLKMGVGIHTGTAIVGDIGAPHRREFTAIGSAVNIASRIEGLTKEFDRPIVVSGSTRAMIDGKEWEGLGEKVVRGGSQPIELYSPVKRAS
jgi:adenylate cyclase